MKTTILSIDGMTCQGCVKSVNGAILQVSGVQDCQTDLATGQATIVYDEHLTDENALKNAVEDAGFELK